MDFKDRTDLPEGIIKAIEEFERIKDDPNLQMEAVSKQIAILDYMQVIEDAENKGEIRGYRNSTYEMIKKMKARGLTLDFIAEITGLDLETIEKL